MNRGIAFPSVIFDLFQTFGSVSVNGPVGLRETKHFGMALNFTHASKQSLYYRANLSFTSS